MRLARLAVMAGVGLLVAAAGEAQTLAPDVTKQVDRAFAKWDRADSPGCALGVYRGGQIVYKSGYGMEDLNEDVHITPGTVFHVASMSKQFTAASVVLLAQQGKLSLDDTASLGTSSNSELPTNPIQHFTIGLRSWPTAAPMDSSSSSTQTMRTMLH